LRKKPYHFVHLKEDNIRKKRTKKIRRDNGKVTIFPKNSTKI